MAERSAPAGPAHKGTVVRAAFRRRAQRAWAVGATGRTGTSLALRARKAGGTERPERAGSGCRTATPTAPALQGAPGFGCVRAVHAASGLCVDYRRSPVAPARARTDAPSRRQRCPRPGAGAFALRDERLAVSVRDAAR